ncbi:glycosyltransferase [Sciscionella sediminilitoris]|uniref:glycosyltransferase n=1 Tax=Sciscionella sediminilitoris TaxID=1445613 RepID=UPI00056AD934|nr:glycosyltransferase [Sciscionella sp. SE31]
MKLAMVSGHASPLTVSGSVEGGGQHVHVAELASALGRCGHEVIVYVRRADREVSSVVDSGQGYRVVHVPAGPARPLASEELLPFLGEFAAFLAERWVKQPPDLAHAQFWTSGLATQLAARRTGTPTVQSFRALDSVPCDPQGNAKTTLGERGRIERIIARNANRVIARSTEEFFRLAEQGCPRSRISVIPSGVNVERFTPEGRCESGTGRRRIVAAGRLVPRKGFTTAISALAHLPDSELIIAGGPDRGALPRDQEAQRLRAYAEEHEVADRVHLLGSVPRERIPALLRSADAVVCASQYESCGMVALEAMACGVPVVASAAGGLADTVVDRVTGLLVRPSDTAALVHALRELFSKPELAKGYGIAGRDRALARYGWERIAADTARAYAVALGEVQTDSGGTPSASPG